MSIEYTSITLTYDEYKTLLGICKCARSIEPPTKVQEELIDKLISTSRVFYTIDEVLYDR